MDARRQLLDAGLTVSLAGMSFVHRFLMFAWCARPLFDEWHWTVAHSRPITLALAAAGPDLARKQEVLPAQTRIRG
jgi:hypothetical protein